MSLSFQGPEKTVCWSLVIGRQGDILKLAGATTGRVSGPKQEV